MQMTVNQRFKQALEKLKELKIIQFNQDIADVLDTDKHRIAYLAKDNGGKLTYDELKLLEKKYPNINWDYVNSGTGSLLNSSDHLMTKESEMLYRKNPDQEKALREIIAGNSLLNEAEQKKILINEAVRLQQKIVDIYDQVDPGALIKSLKSLFK